MTKDRKRVHALSMTFNLLCGTRAGNRTSIVKGPKDKGGWSIVTCQRCKRLRKTGRYA